MKKFIIGAVALSLTGAFAPIAAEAATAHKGHQAQRHVKPKPKRCHMEKKRVRHHGRWVVRSVRVCR
jgi:hypothetical protein